MRKADSYRELCVYRGLFRLQQDIFKLTKSWPRSETFSLIDQIRRSSRSAGANLAEAWAKRRYPAHFLSKLTDADAEVQETGHWLETAAACGYLDTAEHQRLVQEVSAIGRQIGSMINQHESFCY